MKGQSSVLYLILLGTVLAVALISIYLLYTYSKYSDEILLDQSKAYWEGKKPLGIIEWEFRKSGAAWMLIKNNDAVPVEFR